MVILLSGENKWLYHRQTYWNGLIRKTKKRLAMKTLTLTVSDDSKFMLLVSLLRELHFVSIDNETSVNKIKTMRRLPQSVLRPARAEQFKMFSRDELHAR